MNPYYHTQIKGMQSHTRECAGCAFSEGHTYGVAEGFKAGRASRDGLARALNDILEGGNDTSAWAFNVAKRALEADGEGK